MRDRGLSYERRKDGQFKATSGREPVMKVKLRFLGVDVHAETIPCHVQLLVLSLYDYY
jgi:hypothetical protein